MCFQVNETDPDSIDEDPDTHENSATIRNAHPSGDACNQGSSFDGYVYN
jgi:hypothetical protein